LPKIDRFSCFVLELSLEVGAVIAGLR